MKVWERTFWAVFAANLVTAIGMMAFLPFFPTLLEEMGLQDRALIARWTGVIFGAAPLSAAIMGPVWGSIGDRFGRKVMVLRAMLAISLFVGCLGFAQSPWQLLLLRLGQGVFSGFVPPSITLVSVSAPRDVQGRVAGWLQSSLAAGLIIGPLLGALIQSTFGIRSVFLFVAGLSALGALVVGLLAHEDPSLRLTLERWSPTSVLSDVLTDMRELFRSERVRAAVVLLFCVQLGMGATEPLLELFVRDVWSGDPTRVPHLTATLFSALAVARLISAPLWGRLGDRIGHARALTLSGFLAAAVFAGHVLVPAFALLFVLRFTLGIATAGTNASAFGVAATATAVERRGGAVAGVYSARALAVSLGSMIGGVISSLIGLPMLFLLAGAVVAAVLLALRPGRPATPAA